MDIRVAPEGIGYRWLLRHATAQGGLLARAAGVAADEASCRAAVVGLAEAPGESILCVQENDGRWRWRLAGADGWPLAESAASFPDAPACRVSALLMQHVLAGGGQLCPVGESMP
jgi:hypothetical protein